MEKSKVALKWLVCMAAISFALFMLWPEFGHDPLNDKQLTAGDLIIISDQLDFTTNYQSGTVPRFDTSMPEFDNAKIYRQLPMHIAKGIKSRNWSYYVPTHLIDKRLSDISDDTLILVIRDHEGKSGYKGLNKFLMPVRILSNSSR